MRFFSNENRESNDEPSAVDVQTRAQQENPAQAHDDHPERVQSDPVPVPQQRSGSPWSDAPGSADDTADAELADQERADGTSEPGYAGDDRPGGLTDAEAAAAGPDQRDGADAVDLPLDDTTTADRPLAGAHVASDTTTYGPDGTVTTDNGSGEGGVGTAESDTGDPALRDEGGFGDPTAVDHATDRPLETEGGETDRRDESTDAVGRDDSGDAAVRDDSGAVLRDEGGFDDPTAVDPATDRPLDADDTATPTDTTWAGADTTPAAAGGTAEADGRHEAPDEAAPAATTNGTPVEDTSAPVVPIPVPVGGEGATRTEPAAGADTRTAAADKMPGSVTEPDLSTIFAADAASSFQERWREVQLRFVDSPKDATTEAAGLLDEAVEQLAASLRAQKDRLHRVDSDDTEQLRIELRGYRDILNRVIDL